MPRRAVDDPNRFLSHVQAARETDDLFKDFHGDEDRAQYSVAGSRRRRQRLANSPSSAIKTVSLVEENGVLYWRDGVAAGTPASRRRRTRRRGAPSAEESLVLVKEFPTLAPNKIISAIGAIDRHLNPSIEASLRSRLRALRRKPDNSFELGEADVAGPFAGRTLLFVHGTFSNAANMLGEFALPGGPGLGFLGRATQGPKKYDRVLFFDHPTLAVSPIINALELGRLFAGTTGQIDIIAHSRGGLVVRWWLEAFGNSLAMAPAPQVRTILVGSPLHGTSLAAPDKLKNAMSLISNIGSFAEHTLSLVGTANPFLWVAGKLVEVIVSVTGALAKTPLIDALVSIAPGLAGQSAVSNNLELNCLRAGPAVIDPAYYAVVSNFETANPGWQFWRNFRKARLADLATDVIFPGANDLVVDTEYMTDFGVPALKLAEAPCNFGTSDTVWHCNYFRQPKTVDYLSAKLKL
jgi:hypothetical protein